MNKYFCEKEVDIAVHRAELDNWAGIPSVRLVRLIRGFDVFVIFPDYLDEEGNFIQIGDELPCVAKELMKAGPGCFGGDGNMCWVLSLSLEESIEIHHSLVKLFENYRPKEMEEAA